MTRSTSPQTSRIRAVQQNLFNLLQVQMKDQKAAELVQAITLLVKATLEEKEEEGLTQWSFTKVPPADNTVRYTPQEFAAKLNNLGDQCCGGAGQEVNPETGELYGNEYYKAAKLVLKVMK